MSGSLPPNQPAPPRHGLKAGGVTPATLGEKKDRFTHLSQSGKSVWVSGTSPIEGVREPQGERSVPLGDSKGRSPWRAFGDFPRDGKVTRGRRGGAPSPWGLWGRSPHLRRSEEPSLTTCSRRGAAPPRIDGCRDLRPCKKERGPRRPTKIFFIRAAHKCRPTPARCAPPARG